MCVRARALIVCVWMLALLGVFNDCVLLCVAAMLLHVIVLHCMPL